MKLISFVFSFKNEEKNLGELIKRVDDSVKKLSNYDYELIFVNDASDDKSETLLEDFQKKSIFEDFWKKTTPPLSPSLICEHG